MKPLKAVRLQCLYCSNNQLVEVKKCPVKNCVLYSFRFGKNETLPRKPTLKAIKEYCLDCSDNSYAAVKICTLKNCSLLLFRLGKNPNRKGIGKSDGNTIALKKYRDFTLQQNSRHELAVHNSELKV